MKDYRLDVPLALKNTNPAVFIDWLKGYVTRMYNHYWFEKKVSIGIVKDIRGEVGMHPGMSWPYTVEVGITCLAHDDDMVGGGIITFRIEPLYNPFTQEGNWINGTVDVTVTGELTWGSGPREYIRELLQAIAQRWDGVEEQLRKFPWMYSAEDSSDDGTAEQTVAENGEDDRPPWVEIPDHEWHREALKLWWEGNTVPEIANRLFLAEKTVRNRLSELRKTHGEDIVPYAEQLRKMRLR
jgi:hypothetical protein